MRAINPEDISTLNGTIMELPAFTDLKSKDMIQDVLDTFMKDVYIDQLQEQFDTQDFILNERMQDVFFTNYGIDKNYSNKLKGYLKKDMAFQLEKLFQNKGSKEIFRIFSDVFQNVFRKINFYNIRVHKRPTPSGFLFEYKLEPLYITDKDNIIQYPEVPVEQTRKYLMELHNFEEYTAWPMPTNLVYIQVSIGEEVINNMETFLDGMRAYGSTYMQGKFYEYKNSQNYTETIHAQDMELLVNYFKVEITRWNNPDWEFTSAINISSYLPYDPNLVADPQHPDYSEHLKWTRSREEFLQNMQELLEDYGAANRADRKAMENLRRRWQMFLKLKETSKQCFNSYDEIRELVKNKYPLIQEDFMQALALANTPGQEQDNEPIFDFYIYIYSIFLGGTFSNPEDPALGLNTQWPLDYIDVLFGGLFIEADFLKWYFNPVMDLFIRYFFPIEMEYINDLINKVQVRDKWNSISYEDNQNMVVEVGHTSLHPMPRLGLDHQRFDLTISSRKSWLDLRSMQGSFISHPITSPRLEHPDNQIVQAIISPREPLNLRDSINTYVTSDGITYRQAASGCVNPDITKNYNLLTDLLGQYSN